MEEITIAVNTTSGVASIESFTEIKERIVKQFHNPSYAFGKKGLKQAKDDLWRVGKMKKSLRYACEATAKQGVSSGVELKEQINQLESLLWQSRKEISAFISAEEEKALVVHRQEIHRIYKEQCRPLGDMAELIYKSAGFYDSRWDELAIVPKGHAPSIIQRINEVALDIEAIKTMASPYETAMVERYCQSFDLNEILEYGDTLHEVEVASQNMGKITADEDKLYGNKVLKVTGNKKQMEQMQQFMEFLGINAEVLENHMPKEPIGRIAPDFTSFVAVDMEMSGSWGIACGDKPTEIIEIGAVKVVNGEIVDRFSTLVNPNRKIQHHVVKLTGITDAMVKDAPTVHQSLIALKKFVGDAILVGHNIKESDLPVLLRAGRRHGIAFENQYFDTCLFAEKFKKSQQWTGLRLSYLAEEFGVPMTNAHRALDDAEANVGVYFGLQRLAEMK